MKLKKLIIFILVAAFLCFAPVTAASAEEMDTRTMAMINKPGVVFLYTTWSADVTIPGLALDEMIYTDMDSYVQGMIDSGEMSPDDPGNFVTAYITLLTEWLPYYVYDSGSPISQTAYASFIGTGFIVTPDGYIVTNAHVVTTDEEQMKAQFVSDAAYDIVEYDVQMWIDQLVSAFGVSPTDDQIAAFYQMYYDMYAANMTVDNLQGDFQCYMGNVQPGADVSAKALTMDLRKVGESIPGKDVAILKIDQTNLPTVTLGDDTALKTGDEVFAMGYPAIATVTDVLDIDQALQEPTLTGGIISAKKQMSGGWDILQTDADIHGGNSGGPLFNTAGEVVGINTFGMIDETGASASGMNFAVPISIAKQFLNELNIQPSESDFTKQYKQAIVLYNGGDYKGALEILRTINEINPGYPVITELLSECSSKASTQTTESVVDKPSGEPSAQGDTDKPVSGEGKESKSEGPISTTMLIIIIAAAAAAVIVVLILTRRKKNGAQPVYAQPAAPVYTQPVTPPPVQAPPVVPVQPQQTGPVASAKCPVCGAPIDPHAKFCPECGATITPHCKNCGAKLEPDAKFCPECGAKTHE